MAESASLPDFVDRAPRDRYCDLILTGGVTSAIAYPAAIATLATTYRFNSIGGSSSGAGAAALAAAAEYRRRHGSSEGFRILIERTAAISEMEDGKRTGLEWLFQPALHNKRLFDALVPGIAKPKGKGTKLVGGLVRAYGKSRLVLALGVVAAFLLLGLFYIYAHGLVGYSHAVAPSAYWQYTAFGMLALLVELVLAVLLLLVPVIAAAVLFWCDLRRVVKDDFGLCSGFHRLPGVTFPTLVEWLHNLIQEIAGRQKDGAPLTFADLAKAPGAPQDTLGNSSRADAHSIRLQMFTANVTQGRPYLFPQEKVDTALYFDAAEMRELFPKSVVDHMIERSPEPQGPDDLWRMPTDDLPIVVAARMSVSFPALFRAVPLWTRDGPSKPKRCLFSDGGLCSNFPIHLFDSPIPGWPTFGISLHEQPGTAAPLADPVKLPTTEREGQQERWHDFGDKPGTGPRLLGFLGAMFNTVIDWNDATLARLPGVWDRVVRVGLKSGTGGLNIRMTTKEIDDLAALGGKAGRLLLERFAKPSPGADGLADGWNEHRWMRFNLLRDCLAEALSGVSQSAAQRRYALPMTQQIHEGVGKPARRHDPEATNLLAAQAAELEAVLAALMKVESALNAPTAGPPFVAHPRPQLRVRPPL